MKIGILTLPLHYNYGGILQAYALQTVLQRMGNEVEVIDKDFTAYLPWYKKPTSYIKRVVKKYLFHENCCVLLEKKTNYERSVFCRNTSLFIKKNINIRRIKKIKEIHSKDYDAIIVGSDQIWRMYYFKMFFGRKCLDAFLMFTKNWDIKRISYAASFGTDSIELTLKEINQCKLLIRSFNGISVREKSGVKICRDCFDVNATCVLDPTMLLSKVDYLGLLKEFDVIEENNNLVTYILDPTIEKNNIVELIAYDRKLDIVKTNSEVDNKSAKLEDRVQLSVEVWLKNMFEAKFIVTDSFHACVFSILFHKPFVVLGNKIRGMSRLESLLEMFGLRDRLIYSVEEYEKVSEIDILSIDAVLEEKRNESINFLSKSLN